MERLILVFCLLITWIPCQAAPWVQRYRLSYSLGENETRLGLRKAALEDARVRASNEFGSVVMNRQDLKDNDLVEQTRLVSAGLVKLQVESEQLSARGGSAQVDFVIRAEIDDSELDRQLAAMRQDVRKADLVLRLSQENADLRARLNELREMLGRTSDQKLAQDVAVEINKLLGRLAGNSREISGTFEPGAITRAANRNEEHLKGLLERTFYLPLLDSRIEASMGVPSKSRGVVSVPVSVKWTFDVQQMRRGALEFSSPTQEDGIDAREGFCSRVYPRDGIMPALGEWLADEGIALEVGVGSWKEYFVIGGGRMTGVFCVVDRSSIPARTVILSIPEKVADAASSVSVRVVRMSAVDKSWKRMARWDLMNGSF